MIAPRLPRKIGSSQGVLRYDLQAQLQLAVSLPQQLLLKENCLLAIEPF